MNGHEKQPIIDELLGSMAVAGKSYHQPLPPALLDWYVYTRDGGHSIMCVLERDWQEDSDLCDFLVPVPVKAVLRDFTAEGDYIVVDLPYDPLTGLKYDEADEEF